MDHDRFDLFYPKKQEPTKDTQDCAPKAVPVRPRSDTRIPWERMDRYEERRVLEGR